MAAHVPTKPQRKQRVTKGGMRNPRSSSWVSPRLNPDTPFRMQRRMMDMTLGCVSNGTLSAVPTPGYSGTNFVTVGSSSTDSGGVPTLTNVWAPFSLITIMDALADTLTLDLFKEFYIEGVEFTFTMIGGESSGQLFRQSVPEIIIVPDQENETLFTTIEDCLAYEGAQSRFLTAYKPMKWSIQPKPAAAIYQSLTTFGFGYSTGKSWFNLGSSRAVPHYSGKGVIRNFPPNTDSGCWIRVEAVVTFALRRPY